jgi:hypothetical protein
MPVKTLGIDAKFWWEALRLSAWHVDSLEFSSQPLHRSMQTDSGRRSKLSVQFSIG